MKITSNVGRLQQDIKKIIDNCQQAGLDLVEKGEEIITTTTDKLLEESVLRSPVDEGLLGESHEREIEKNSDVLEITGHVYIPSNAPASDYALHMHESNYNLGPESKQKDAAVNVDVGRKYMERALEENRRAFSLYIVKELRSFFKNGK